MAHIKTLAPDFNYMGYSTRFIVSFKKKGGEKYMLQRKKDKNEVYISLGNPPKRYWIKSEEDFEALRQSQPLKDLEWQNVAEVDELTDPYEGAIIGKPDFSVSALLRMLLGKISGRK